MTLESARSAAENLARFLGETIDGKHDRDRRGAIRLAAAQAWIAYRRLRLLAAEGEASSETTPNREAV